MDASVFPAVTGPWELQTPNLWEINDSMSCKLHKNEVRYGCYSRTHRLYRDVRAREMGTIFLLVTGHRRFYHSPRGLAIQALHRFLSPTLNVTSSFIQIYIIYIYESREQHEAFSKPAYAGLDQNTYCILDCNRTR